MTTGPYGCGELGGGDAIDAPLNEEDGDMAATMTVTPGITGI